MSRDTALHARASRTGETVFSVYSWAKPTVSLGRNQPARGLYDMHRIRDAGLAIVRRPTGGRAIVHNREVTYSVTAPVGRAPGLRETYHQINRLLERGLAQLGVLVEAATPAARSPVPSNRPCFETPSEGELVAGGAKLVGSAQWRDENALLQHGSILVDDDQSTLMELVTNSDDISPLSPPATLSSLLGRKPAVEEVAEVMFDAVRELEDPDATFMFEDEIREQALSYLPQYLDEAWTWRR